MSRARHRPRLTIDHREVPFSPGDTVLDVARAQGIDIPTLCWHEDLSAHGGCRLCMVKIDGMRGYPIACTTRAEAGMNVLTETGTLREMRREILQLILSEHPSSCFACEEWKSCALSQTTIRKAGVPTGCRYCPNDRQCELQGLVRRLGVEELEYPIAYRGLPPEHDDPFFDRDYNLCILCGRCVRVCQEVRCAGIIAFQNRGSEMRIGPAFGANHAESGCDFCGACASVCPTGALFEKGSKWDGPPDGTEVSTCPFCSVGCRVELNHRGGRLSWVGGHREPEINDGHLCVRGRFCLPEATHHHERLRKPHLRRAPYFRQVAWDTALDEVAARLSDVAPDEFLMLVSGDVTNETMWVAQKFVREVMGSDAIDSTARESLAGGLGLWTRLFSHPISLRALADSDSVLVVGLDRRFSLSVIVVRTRQALARGGHLVTISANDSALARDARPWLAAAPGTEVELLELFSRRLVGEPTEEAGAILRRAGVADREFEEAVATFSKGERRTLVIGPQTFARGTGALLRRTYDRFRSSGCRNVVPLPFAANARGALELGVFRELLPGGKASAGRGPALSDLESGRALPRVHYLVGESPFLDRPDIDYIIAQDLYPPPFPVDAFLPAASFAETGGTLTNLEGRVQEVVPVESPPHAERFESPRPDWRILADLARRRRKRGFAYRDWRAVLREIRQQVPEFPSRPDPRPRCLGFELPTPSENGGASNGRRIGGRGDFVLAARPSAFRHRAGDLTARVEGLRELGLEEGFCMHPDDVAAIGGRPEGEITVTWASRPDARATATVRADENCPIGVVEYWRPTAFGGLERRRSLAPLYRLGPDPVRVKVTAGD